MKTIQLINQRGDKPSLMISGGKLRVVGTLSHMDEIKPSSRTDLQVLRDWCDKELSRTHIPHIPSETMRCICDEFDEECEILRKQRG